MKAIIYLTGASLSTHGPRVDHPGASGTGYPYQWSPAHQRHILYGRPLDAAELAKVAPDIFSAERGHRIPTPALVPDPSVPDWREQCLKIKELTTWNEAAATEIKAANEYLYSLAPSLREEQPFGRVDSLALGIQYTFEYVQAVAQARAVPPSTLDAIQTAVAGLSKEEQRKLGFRLVNATRPPRTGRGKNRADVQPATRAKKTRRQKAAPPA